MSPAPAPTKPHVLLVGPYERDNVGDLLFLLVTERYLDNAHVTAAAPFAADMTALLDRTIPAYGPLLRSSRRFDAIWTVGGQVGALGVARAYRMSASAADYTAFSRASRFGRRRILRRAAGGPLPLSPYIPQPVAGTTSILNSAGVSGIRHVEPPRRGRLISLLREQDHIAVRDEASSRYLTALGIEHRLVPDAVHALRLLHPEADRGPDADDVAIFQASSAILRRLGTKRAAARLARSPQLRGLRLRLLMAGTATGHDSQRDLETLAAAVRAERPGADVDVLTERRPLDVVDRIAAARVVVGSSLHVRIVAAAYAVPRITLARPKAARYARTWDPDMPYDVAIDDLDHALEAAFTSGRRTAYAVPLADELSRQAHEQLCQLARRVTAPRPALAAAGPLPVPAPCAARA